MVSYELEFLSFIDSCVYSHTDELSTPRHFKFVCDMCYQKTFQTMTDFWFNLTKHHVMKTYWGVEV
jgi:hypothetical protein